MKNRPRAVLLFIGNWSFAVSPQFIGGKLLNLTFCLLFLLDVLPWGEPEVGFEELGEMVEIGVAHRGGGGGGTLAMT